MSNNQLVKKKAYTSKERTIIKEINGKLRHFGIPKISRLQTHTISFLMVYPKIFQTSKYKLHFSRKELQLFKKVFYTTQGLNFLKVYSTISRIEKSNFEEYIPRDFKKLTNFDKSSGYLQINRFWNVRKERDLFNLVLRLSENYQFKRYNPHLLKGFKRGKNYRCIEQALNKEIFLKYYVHNNDYTQFYDLSTINSADRPNLTILSQKSLESTLIKEALALQKLFEPSKKFIQNISKEKIPRTSHLDFIYDFKDTTIQILQKSLKRENPYRYLEKEILPLINQKYNAKAFLSYFNKFLLKDNIRFKKIFEDKRTTLNRVESIYDKVPYSYGSNFGILILSSDTDFEKAYSEADGSITLRFLNKNISIEGKYQDAISLIASVTGRCDSRKISPHILYDATKISQVLEKQVEPSLKRNILSILE